MYNEVDQRQSNGAKRPSMPAAAYKPALRSQNLAPSGSFWRRFQEWERADRAASPRPMGIAC